MSALSKAIADIATLAVKMETDGIKFYTKAGRSVKSPSGKIMFRSLASDEENHLRILSAIIKDLFDQELDEAFEGNPVSRVRSVFEKNKVLLEKRLKADPGEAEALDLAMKMEDEGYKLYLGAARKARGSREKALFERLAAEEQQHYRMLENALAFLNDTGNWFIYEEHALMDGG